MADHPSHLRSIIDEKKAELQKTAQELLDDFDRNLSTSTNRQLTLAEAATNHDLVEAFAATGKDQVDLTWNTMEATYASEPGKCLKALAFLKRQILRRCTEIKKAADQAAAARASKSRTPSTLAVIEVSDRRFDTIYDETCQALVDKNEPPQYFIRGSALVYYQDSGLHDFNKDSLRLTLSRVATFQKPKGVDKHGEPREPELVAPPLELLGTMIAVPPAALPVASRVVTTPYFSRNGDLVTTDGYHADDGVIVALDPSLVVPAVSDDPTDEEVAEARRLIEVECLGDFPFATPADKAHEIALIILPFVRSMIDGNTPLHILEAPESGSGKSLAADVASIVATGHEMHWSGFPEDERERGQTMFSLLRGGGTYVAFDNVRGLVDSRFLEKNLTTRVLEERLFRTQSTGTADNNAAWIMTVSNAHLTRDLARRSVRARIDPRLERPEERRGFRHNPLGTWIKAHRSELVHAVLTLVQHWLSCGKPASPRSSGTFPEWSAVIGGILAAAGVDGFLDPDAAMYSADLDREEAAIFVSAWAALPGREPVTAKQLVDQLCAPLLLVNNTNTGHWGEPDHPKAEVAYMASILARCTAAERPKRLGTWLAGAKGRVLDGHRIECLGSRNKDKTCKWDLVDCPAAPPVG